VVKEQERLQPRAGSLVKTEIRFLFQAKGCKSAMKPPPSPPEDPSSAPPLQTAPKRDAGHGKRRARRVKLALSGDEEELVVKNATQISWKVYHNFHQLGILDAAEKGTYQLIKAGLLTVRPLNGDQVEYLVISLSHRVKRVLILQQHFGIDVELYDLRMT
jgi:hypothetical protein